MVVYSHSRISTFEQCKYKYKLQYLDKVKVDVPTTVEAFMGDLVHRTLEKLYKDLKFEKLNSKEDLLKFFNDLWKKEWSDDILIAKKELTEENYRRMGERYISNYYDRYKPFNQMTVLGLETQDRLTLPNGKQFHVRIDKLACAGNTYFVCDYKTNIRMKTQEEADADRQLAMYSIWVKDKFKDAKKVVLLWHMLAFDKDITSERTDEQLKALQNDVVAKIEEIESCKDFPQTVSSLCDYCIYKSICPAFKHEAELEKLPPEEFKDEDGVKLVDAYTLVLAKKKKLEKEIEELKERLIAFAKQKNISIVYGSNKKISVKPWEVVVLPEDKTRLIELLKKKGIYESVSSLSFGKVNSLFTKGGVDDEIAGLLSRKLTYRLSVSKRKNDAEK